MSVFIILGIIFGDAFSETEAAVARVNESPSEQIETAIVDVAQAEEEEEEYEGRVLVAHKKML